MEEASEKRTRVGRQEWAKRVERWRDSGLTSEEFAAELGINARTLTYWAWTLKQEAAGKKRKWPAKRRPQREPAEVRPAFVEVGSMAKARFELELRGRRLLIPDGFDPQQLRALVAILESP